MLPCFLAGLRACLLGRLVRWVFGWSVGWFVDFVVVDHVVIVIDFSVVCGQFFHFLILHIYGNLLAILTMSTPAVGNSGPTLVILYYKTIIK